MDKLNKNTNFDDELLSAYVDGELTAAERAAVEARLQADSAARELVAEMQALSGTLRSLPKLAATEDVRSAVLGQVTDKQPVTLPEYRPGPLRRLVWPALAIAAALVLMFTQEDRQENGDLAKVEVRGGELRDQPAVGRTIPAFEGPEMPERVAASAPEAAASAVEEIAVLDEGASAGVALGTELARTQPPLNGRTQDALTKVDAELGIVHLTLTDLRTGTERFDRLLLSNGVQVLADTVEADRVSGKVAADSAVAESTTGARALSAPADGLAGAAPTASSSELTSSEPEMVLVEAPPQQIEQILLGCSNDTEAIEAVSIDPSASGTNLLPEKQRLLGYQQYERAARSRAEAKGYSITPEQQGVIEALNSLPTPEQSDDMQPTAEPRISRDSAFEDSAANLQQQEGWATKFRGGGKAPQLQQLQTEVNNRRNQFFGHARQQQAAQLDKKLAKQDSALEQPMRVLFLLHPSEQAAER